MKIDIRSEHCLYIELNDYVYYIDDSTNEQIIQGGAYLALSAGDMIVCFEESSSDFHVTISGAEYYRQS